MDIPLDDDLVLHSDGEDDSERERPVRRMLTKKEQKDFMRGKAPKAMKAKLHKSSSTTSVGGGGRRGHRRGRRQRSHDSSSYDSHEDASVEPSISSHRSSSKRRKHRTRRSERQPRDVSREPRQSRKGRGKKSSRTPSRSPSSDKRRSNKKRSSRSTRRSRSRKHKHALKKKLSKRASGGRRRGRRERSGSSSSMGSHASSTRSSDHYDDEYTGSDSEEEYEPRRRRGKMKRGASKRASSSKLNKKASASGRGRGRREEAGDDLFDSSDDEDRKAASRRALERKHTGLIKAKPRTEIRLNKRNDVPGLELYNQFVEFSTGDGKKQPVREWRFNMATASIVLDYRQHKFGDLLFTTETSSNLEDVPLADFKFPYIRKFKEVAKTEGGPPLPGKLERQGARLGDWIVAVNGKMVKNADHLELLLRESERANLVKLTIRFCLPVRWEVRLDPSGKLYYKHMKKNKEQDRRPFTSEMQELARELGVGKGVMGLTASEKKKLGVLCGLCCFCCPLTAALAFAT